jgi:hypothetical protein
VDRPRAAIPRRDRAADRPRIAPWTSDADRPTGSDEAGSLDGLHIDAWGTRGARCSMRSFSADFERLLVVRCATRAAPGETGAGNTPCTSTLSASGSGEPRVGRALDERVNNGAGPVSHAALPTPNGRCSRRISRRHALGEGAPCGTSPLCCSTPCSTSCDPAAHRTEGVRPGDAPVGRGAFLRMARPLSAALIGRRRCAVVWYGVALHGILEDAHAASRECRTARHPLRA